jgi:hypothetical protein
MPTSEVSSINPKSIESMAFTEYLRIYLVHPAHIIRCVSPHTLHSGVGADVPWPALGYAAVYVPDTIWSEAMGAPDNSATDSEHHEPSRPSKVVRASAALSARSHRQSDGLRPGPDEDTPQAESAGHRLRPVCRQAEGRKSRRSLSRSRDP